MFNVKTSDMKMTPSGAHQLRDITTPTVEQMQRKLDDAGIELLIVTEGLTKLAIDNGMLRVASYGEDCERGSTYFVGSPEEVNSYIDSIRPN